MSVPNVTFWVGFVCLGVFGCGARSDVYCSLGECRSTRGSSQGPGELQGGLDPDNSPPEPSDGVQPPEDTPSEPPPQSIEMPPDEDLPVSSPAGRLCGDSRAAPGPIVVESASELEALRGCRRIDGDLRISGFVAPDLSALSGLSQVRGTLTLGVTAQLDGLESLQEVWNLTLDGLQAPSLLPLQNLRRIGRYQRDPAGLLEILGSGGFSDLTGLSGIRELRSVRIESTGLISLRGLTLPSDLEDLFIESNASLVDLGDVASLRRAERIIIDGAWQIASLGALGALESTNVLTLEELRIQSLDELQSLARVTDIAVRDNDALLDVDRLSSVEFQSLSLVRNPLLQALPEFSVQTEVQQLQIRDNDALTTGPRFPNVIVASRILISDNAALTRIDGFPQLANVRTLEVRDNPSLLAVEFAALGGYDVARIVCNPALAESAVTPDLVPLGGRLELRGNLGSSGPCN